MQHSKDFLLRDIEKLSLMLISLIEKVKGFNTNTASGELDEIDTALQSQLDLSLGKISKMQANEFKSHISTVHETHLKHLAELLYHLVLKSDLLELNQGFSTSKIAEKAILLIDILDEKSKNFFDRTPSYERAFKNIFVTPAKRLRTSLRFGLKTLRTVRLRGEIKTQ